MAKNDLTKAKPNETAIPALFPDQKAAEHAVKKLKDRKIEELHAEIAGANEKKGGLSGIFSSKKEVGHEDLRSALEGWGVPADDALRFQQGVAAGRVLVIAHAKPEDAPKTAAMLKQVGGELGGHGGRLASESAVMLANPASETAEKEKKKADTHEQSKKLAAEEMAEAEKTMERESAERRAAEADRRLAELGAVEPTEHELRAKEVKPAPTVIHPRETPETQPIPQGRGEQVIPLRDESIHVVKEKVAHPEPAVHKKEVTEMRTIQVPVKREELVIEHRNDKGEMETTRLPLSEEQVRVVRDKDITSEVKIRRETVTENRVMEVPVSREEFEIEKKPESEVSKEEHPRKIA